MCYNLIESRNDSDTFARGCVPIIGAPSPHASVVYFGSTLEEY